MGGYLHAGAQVLDTGMGAPKHPMFLLGTRYNTEDKTSQALVSSKLRRG